MCHAAFFFILIFLPDWSTQVVSVEIEALTQNITISGNSTNIFKEVRIDESEIYGGAYTFLFTTHLVGIVLAYISMLLSSSLMFSLQYICDLSTIFVY